MKRLSLEYEGVEALRSGHLDALSKGRAFIVGASGVGERESCELAIGLRGSTQTFLLPAEVVWLGPSGVGLALTLDAQTKTELAHFVESVAAAGAKDDGDLHAHADADAELDEGLEHATPARRNLHDRIRALSLQQREEVARRGALPERVALERAFGGSVWEGLLQNPQLTVAEVARIAKNGTLPKPLVSLIVANSAWLASTEVQRGLLTNPRCSGAHLERVLHAMKTTDLNRLAQICPYRPEVRAAVMRLVKR